MVTSGVLLACGLARQQKGCVLLACGPFMQKGCVRMLFAGVRVLSLGALLAQEGVLAVG
jgi:hypothetical protein